MGATRVVLVRHGESVAQEEGFLSGHDTCKGLSARGRRQVEALRDRLLRTGELADVSAVYASILPRAIETAEILAPALGAHELRTDCGFCESHVGEAEGKAYTEIEGVWGEDWSDDHRPVPGWETWREMGARVGSALDEVLARHQGGTVVVACHGGVIVQAMQRWLALDEQVRATGAWFAPVNSSVTEFRGGAGSPYGGRTLDVQLVRFNDHAHLEGTDLLGSSA